MFPKGLKISSEKAQRILTSLGEPSMGLTNSHLKDEDFVNYAAKTLSHTEMQPIVKHLQICDECANLLEQYLEKSSIWTSLDSASHLAEIRSKHIEIKRDQTIRNVNDTLISHLSQKLRKLSLGDQGIKETVQNKAGSVICTMELDRQDNLIIQIVSSLTDVAGLWLQVTSGSAEWQTEIKNYHASTVEGKVLIPLRQISNIEALDIRILAINR